MFETLRERIEGLLKEWRKADVEFNVEAKSHVNRYSDWDVKGFLLETRMIRANQLDQVLDEVEDVSFDDNP